MSTLKKSVLLVAAVSASAVALGVFFTLKKRTVSQRSGDDEELFTSTTTKTVAKRVDSSPPAETHPAFPTPIPVPASAKDSAGIVAQCDAVLPKAAASFDATASLLDEVIKEMDDQSAGKVEKMVFTTTNSTDRVVFPHLGVSMKPPAGWEIREELSPIPNIALITVWNPEFADEPNAEVPGAVPVIILSVEDLRAENLNLLEFKDRSREMSLNQMMMMTGGRIEPIVRKDAAVREGPFRHMLEYAQSLPPFFDIAVINLLEVRNGVAYVFQCMSNAKMMNKYKQIFMDIARDVEVLPGTVTSLGYLEVFTGTLKTNIDTNWSWSLEDGEDGAVATFETFSSVKRERIKLYLSDKAPVTEFQMREEKDVSGVHIVSYFDGEHERKTLTYNGYTMVLSPCQKAISYLQDEILISALKSVQPSDESQRTDKRARFVSPECGYMFDVVPGSRVVATQIGKGTVVYAPLGLPQGINADISPEDSGPTVTIRYGSPEVDPDCMHSIEEWHSRMLTEAEDGSITGIKVIPMKGTDCLTFVSKSMLETEPGKRTEVQGNVYLFVRNGATTLIRWETTAGLWRKYERGLSVFLDSFTFL